MLRLLVRQIGRGLGMSDVDSREALVGESVHELSIVAERLEL